MNARHEELKRMLEERREEIMAEVRQAIGRMPLHRVERGLQKIDSDNGCCGVCGQPTKSKDFRNNVRVCATCKK